MSSDAALTVQETTDPNVKAYNTRFEMTSGPEVGSRGCTEGLSEFGRLVLSIRGIAQIHISPYILLVTKAPLFSWTEVEPAVVDLLKEFARSQQQLEATASMSIEVLAKQEKIQLDEVRLKNRIKGSRPLSTRAIRSGLTLE